MLTCPACGTQNADTANFCISCGIDLSTTATEQKLRTDSAVRPGPGTPPMTSPSVEMPPGYLDAAASSPVPPRPSMPSAPPPVYTPPPNYGTFTSASVPAYAKDRTVALLLEVLPGLVGFLGIGWFYAGNTTAGLAWLLGFWIGNIIAVVLDVVSLGCFVLPHIVLFIAAVPVSAFLLYNYSKQHLESFGP